MSGEDDRPPSHGLRLELPPRMATSDASAAVAEDDLSPSEALLTPSQPAPSKLDSSLTPPPSTQQPPVNRVSVARTPTPQPSQLSSPPPTKLAEPVGSGLEEETQSAQLPSSEWIETASLNELRERVSELANSLRQARAESASYKMQYSMLRLESGEQHQRMLVELDMVQREVEVLQMAEARRDAAEAMRKSQHHDGGSSSSADPNAANAALLHEMSRHCATLQRENDEYQDANAQLHRTLEYREDQVSRLTEYNERLRTRIRSNREHTNSYLEYIHDNSPQSLFSTPHQPNTQSRVPLRHDAPLSAQSTGLAPIDALLAAGQVLSQETTTAPTTPHRAHGGGSGRRGFHQRAVHSLSSLPSTPQRSRHLNTSAGPGTLHTPVHPVPVAPMTHSSPRRHYEDHQPAPLSASYSTPRRHVRARSSDSTITASSVDGGGGHGSGNEDDDVPESQASQAATSMLRRTPAQSLQGSQKSSFGGVDGAGGPGGGLAGARIGGLRQTKLFGQITKPGVGVGMPLEKRRLSDNATQPELKRARMGEGVGLGIH